jgi:hypothetical protein
MGRKKRKVEVDETSTLVADGVPGGPPPPDLDLPPPRPVLSGDPRKASAAAAATPAVINIDEEAAAAAASVPKPKHGTALASSYAMKTHSAEIIDEDIYVLDGSEDDDEEDAREVEMVLIGSRMGVMRRGIHHPMLVQPNRQWTRKGPTKAEDGGAAGDEAAKQKRLKEQEEELAKLDPVQRAARLLVEKQRKLEEAKETARRVEAKENAGRDPCLFSKRTAFDIRFDQIDDKPWIRGGDMTDFFNYGLLKEDWLEYAEQQLLIRQELTDASRQRGPPDPTVVPVTPRAPQKQTPKVAVAPPSANGSDDEDVLW